VEEIRKQRGNGDEDQERGRTRRRIAVDDDNVRP
jgi:hypothetical protein